MQCPFTQSRVPSNLDDILPFPLSYSHTQKKDKHRIKGKGRRCCFGTKLFKFLAILHQDDFEEQLEFNLFFKSSWCNSSYSSNRPGAKQHGSEYILSLKQQRGPLPSFLHLFFFHVQGSTCTLFCTVFLLYVCCPLFE